MNRHLVSLIVLIFASISLNAQGFLKTQGKQIIDDDNNPVILRGMGLGGWMLQEGYMLQTAGFANAQYQIREAIEELIGSTDTELFYQAWRANHVRKADIDSLKSWGFNSVRLPMHYNLFTLPIEEEPIAGQQTWLDTGFELTDQLIDWCKQNELYVILDLHAAPGGQGMDQGISDYDPSKPSLWESTANKDKTVALWKRIAERYADEPWVAGYDLLNEVNWSLPGNVALRNLYEEITDSIRTVDQNHMIIIEGNWFANDFTGLTPPWDDNMVYSPHKYWSINDQASIQWVLNIREEHNIPLYLGESGENSNTWFRDAIHLLEENQIGWAWWPMKKVEAIAGPLSVVKSDAYQSLLDYWNNGGTPPSASFAKAALMDLTEKLKIENCIYQRDVIDAMFRQVATDEVKPFNTQSIPGVVYPTDFDLGQNKFAYFDSDVATYHVSTGSYSAWNQGWAYRNDGVDIQVTEDNVNTNGYNVGWLNTGEWMQYDVDVDQEMVYDIEVRVASTGTDGRFHFNANEADVTSVVAVPNTGGWQSWQTVTVSDVVLSPTDKKLRFYCDQGGFNLGSFNFIATGATTSLETEFLSAETQDEQTVALHLNKRLEGPLPSGNANFSIKVDGVAVTINEVVLNPANSRMILLTVDTEFEPNEEIRISYNGTQIVATDGIALSTFTNRLVKNNIPLINTVPGRVEAEDFFFQVGIELESTTDAGGGQNIGYLDNGDYADYLIEVTSSGIYEVTYRTAAESATGKLEMQIMEADGNFRTLHNVSFPPTGGWQNWAETKKTVSFPQPGLFTIRLFFTASQFNINWMEFDNLTSTADPVIPTSISMSPNPTSGFFDITGSIKDATDLSIQVFNATGQIIKQQELQVADDFQTSFDLSTMPTGCYWVCVRGADGIQWTRKLVKI